ncbi:hypothetical protein DFP73DRAFT_172025 [Morchella snyderi]|nr:hypothetical protein DFP73DRAFT_172025 [Morchella snyderi]
MFLLSVIRSLATALINCHISTSAAEVIGNGEPFIPLNEPRYWDGQLGYTPFGYILISYTSLTYMAYYLIIPGETTTSKTPRFTIYYYIKFTATKRNNIEQEFRQLID